MALQIRQKKKKPGDQLPMGYERTYLDDERERNGEKTRRSFIMLIAVAMLILVILVVAAISATFQGSSEPTIITAADTFAISQYEQQAMRESSTKFAEGLLVYQYCQEDDAALQGKEQALAEVADSSNLYSVVESLSNRTPLISVSNFAPVITTPTLIDPTQAYAGSFTFKFDAAAADMSEVSDENPSGTFADAGWEFSVTFRQAAYNSGEGNENAGADDSQVDESSEPGNRWMIVGANITQKENSVTSSVVDSSQAGGIAVSDSTAGNGDDNSNAGNSNTGNDRMILDSSDEVTILERPARTPAQEQPDAPAPQQQEAQQQPAGEVEQPEAPDAGTAETNPDMPPDGTELYFDDATGRYYYYDEVDNAYYYYDGPIQES